MNRSRGRRLLATGLLCGLLGLTAFPAPARAQQPVPYSPPYSTDYHPAFLPGHPPAEAAARDRGHRLIGNNDSLIARYMYPASTLDRVEFAYGTDLGDGSFELLYTFRFKGNGLWRPFYGEQIFRFDRSGRLLSTRNGQHNTTWAPGAATETFLDVVRVIVRAKLNVNSAAFRTAMELIDQVRVRDVLEFILVVTEPAPAPTTAPLPLTPLVVPATPAPAPRVVPPPRPADAIRLPGDLA